MLDTSVSLSDCEGLARPFVSLLQVRGGSQSSSLRGHVGVGAVGATRLESLATVCRTVSSPDRVQHIRIHLFHRLQLYETLVVSKTDSWLSFSVKLIPTPTHA